MEKMKCPNCGSTEFFVNECDKTATCRHCRKSYSLRPSSTYARTPSPTNCGGGSSIITDGLALYGLYKLFEDEPSHEEPSSFGGGSCGGGGSSRSWSEPEEETSSSSEEYSSSSSEDYSSSSSDCSDYGSDD